MEDSGRVLFRTKLDLVNSRSCSKISFSYFVSFFPSKLPLIIEPTLGARICQGLTDRGTQSWLP